MIAYIYPINKMHHNYNIVEIYSIIVTHTEAYPTRSSYSYNCKFLRSYCAPSIVLEELHTLGQAKYCETITVVLVLTSEIHPN